MSTSTVGSQLKRIMGKKGAIPIHRALARCNRTRQCDFSSSAGAVTGFTIFVFFSSLYKIQNMDNFQV
jgi:hypothetical protein